MKFTQATLLLLLLVVGNVISFGQTQPESVGTGAVEVTGSAGIKSNTKGTLTVENGTLKFATSKSSYDVPVASIQDVVTGNDSKGEW